MSFPACALRETSLSRRVAGLCPVSRVMLSRCLLARHSACGPATDQPPSTRQTSYEFER